MSAWLAPHSAKPNLGSGALSGIAHSDPRFLSGNRSDPSDPRRELRNRRDAALLAGLPVCQSGNDRADSCLARGFRNYGRYGDLLHSQIDSRH